MLDDIWSTFRPLEEPVLFSPGLVRFGEVLVLHYTLYDTSNEKWPTKVVIQGIAAADGVRLWTKETHSGQLQWARARAGAADGSGRFFIMCHSGRILVLSPDGKCVEATGGLQDADPPIPAGSFLVQTNPAWLQVSKIDGEVVSWCWSKHFKWVRRAALGDGLIVAVHDGPNGGGASGYELAATEKLLWSSDLPISPPEGVAPVVAAGQVHLFSGKGDVYTLDAAKGSLLWKQSLGAKFTGTPCIVSGPPPVLACSTEDGRLSLLAAGNGEPKGVLQLPGQIVTDLETAGGRLFFGTERPWNAVWSVNPADLTDVRLRETFRSTWIAPHLGAVSDSEGMKVFLVTAFRLPLPFFDKYKRDQHYFQLLWLSPEKHIQVNRETLGSARAATPKGYRFHLLAAGATAATPLKVTATADVTVTIGKKTKYLKGRESLWVDTDAQGKLTLEVQAAKGPPLLVWSEGMPPGEAVALVLQA